MTEWGSESEFSLLTMWNHHSPVSFQLSVLLHSLPAFMPREETRSLETLGILVETEI